MKSSCGALFYAYDPAGKLGIILGLEGKKWLPFKGCNEPGESLEQTAIREIREETCGLIDISHIDLEHQFTSKRKHYYIGLCEVPYDCIQLFEDLRVDEERNEYLEKKKLKFFPFDEVLYDDLVHNITKASIRYYWNHLKRLDAAASSMTGDTSLMTTTVNNKTTPVSPVNTTPDESSNCQATPVDNPTTPVDNTTLVDNQAIYNNSAISPDTIPTPTKSFTPINILANGRLRKHSVPVSYAKNKYTGHFYDNLIADIANNAVQPEEIIENQQDKYSNDRALKIPRISDIDVNTTAREYTYSERYNQRNSMRDTYHTQPARRPSKLLKRPQKFNIYHTPLEEHQRDMARVWRK